MLEKLPQPGDAHIHQLGDGLAADLHVIRLLPQTAPFANLADGFARIPGKQVFILNLVFHAFHHLEKAVDSRKIPVPVPEKFFLLLS